MNNGQAQEKWKIEVNDRYQKVVGSIMALATASLILPPLFLREFLAIPKEAALMPLLNSWIYCSWTMLSASIIFGVSFYYLSAKWIKSAWGQPVALSARNIERLLDWAFWLSAGSFVLGLIAFVCFVISSAVSPLHIQNAETVLPLSHGKSMEIKDWKEVAETVNAAVTSVAIFVGGFWAYLKFIKNRVKFPRADVSHQLYVKPLTPAKTLVHVTAVTTNTGAVLLPITHVWTRIYQIFPPSQEIKRVLETTCQLEYEKGGSEIDWPELGCLQIVHEKGAAEIEPGEFERFEFDFIIDQAIETIAVYTFFENSAKAGPGWCRTTIIDLKKGDASVNSPITT